MTFWSCVWNFGTATIYGKLYKYQKWWSTSRLRGALFSDKNQVTVQTWLVWQLGGFQNGFTKITWLCSVWSVCTHTQEKRYLIVFDLICFWLGFRYVWRCDKSHHKLICWLWNSKPAWISEVFSTLGIQTYNVLPVVPHKAVAEVSKIGNL